jgi:hypothetical protein
MLIELTTDERLMLAFLISGALGELGFEECPGGGHPRVRERLALAEAILRGEHRPRRRRLSRRRVRPEPEP